MNKCRLDQLLCIYRQSYVWGCGDPTWQRRAETLRQRIRAQVADWLVRTGREELTLELT